jgi:hypothetical protein
MRWVATVLSALFAGIGAIGVIAPGILIDVGRTLATPEGLLAVAALRIVFGGSLLIAAQGSRAPNALRAFGIVILIAGLATPMIGVARARNGLAAISADGGAWVRVAGTVALALGSSFVWVLTPRAAAPQRR